MGELRAIGAHGDRRKELLEDVARLYEEAASGKLQGLVWAANYDKTLRCEWSGLWRANDFLFALTWLYRKGMRLWEVSIDDAPRPDADGA